MVKQNYSLLPLAEHTKVFDLIFRIDGVAERACFGILSPRRAGEVADKLDCEMRDYIEQAEGLSPAAHKCA